MLYFWPGMNVPWMLFPVMLSSSAAAVVSNESTMVTSSTSNTSNTTNTTTHSGSFSQTSTVNATLVPSTRDPCFPNPCKNAVDCLVLRGTGYKCICEEGWSGARCTKRDLCVVNTCAAGATCVANGTQFHCNCPSDKKGRLCEEDKLQVFELVASCIAITMLLILIGLIIENSFCKSARHTDQAGADLEPGRRKRRRKRWRAFGGRGSDDLRSLTSIESADKSRFKRRDWRVATPDPLNIGPEITLVEEVQLAKEWRRQWNEYEAAMMAHYGPDWEYDPYFVEDDGRTDEYGAGQQAGSTQGMTSPQSRGSFWKRWFTRRGRSRPGEARVTGGDFSVQSVHRKKRHRRRRRSCVDTCFPRVDRRRTTPDVRSGATGQDIASQGGGENVPQMVQGHEQVQLSTPGLIDMSGQQYPCSSRQAYQMDQQQARTPM